MEALMTCPVFTIIYGAALFAYDAIGIALIGWAIYTLLKMRNGGR
jgi:hypothetical protein